LAAIWLKVGAVAQGPALGEKACAVGGGHIEHLGKAQAAYCVTPLRGAGKVCAKKSDCLGECLTDFPPTGSEPHGRCQAWKEPLFGCVTRLDEQGKLEDRCTD